MDICDEFPGGCMTYTQFVRFNGKLGNPFELILADDEW